ncbi:MAG: hypothetical protein ACRD5H_14710 [Nitrososphaerales archaeon]
MNKKLLGIVGAGVLGIFAFGVVVLSAEVPKAQSTSVTSDNNASPSINCVATGGEWHFNEGKHTYECEGIP